MLTMVLKDSLGRYAYMHVHDCIYVHTSLYDSEQKAQSNHSYTRGRNRKYGTETVDHS